MINIQINQVGYLPNEYKIATFRMDDTKSVSESINKEKKAGKTFKVIDTQTNSVIYEGQLSDAISSEFNGEVNQVADFSKVTKPGEYVIESEDGEKSYEFSINKNVYDDILSSTMKMFYLQRCGVKLETDYAKIYAHDACHNTMAKVYGTDKYIDVSGAWHDAGDYGRYIVAGAKAAVDLMMAYEYYPEAMSRPYIESGSLVVSGAEEYETAGPEILDEIKYELDWMLKMQDKESGGVYHKVTCAGFPGFVMPEEEREELIVSPISDTATADFAATMAYAYRFYSKVSEDFLADKNEANRLMISTKAIAYKLSALKYMEAAEKAMGFLENGGVGAFTNPNGIVTGEYGDERTVDEYYWAYAEMYKTTGDKKYEDAMKAIDLETVPGEFGWKEVGDYAFYAYITAEWADKDKELNETLYNRFVEEAEAKYANFEKDPYGASIYGNFYWGCNMEIADNARRFIILDKLEGTDKYKDAIDAQLNYLLGNNPNSKCFVTGFGTNSPKNPHHRPSVAAKRAMPGMLVGGPEPLLLDDIAKKALKGEPPAKCYLDNTDSYSTNEITIYWNSPLVFLLAHEVSK